jgi:hypothetical protein
MGGTAVAILVLSLAATVAAMALPPAYPNAPIEVWRFLFWLGILGMILSVVYLIWENMGWPKIGATFAIIVGAALFLGGIDWFWRASQSEAIQSTPPSSAEIPSATKQPPAPTEFSSQPNQSTGITLSPSSHDNKFFIGRVDGFEKGLDVQGTGNTFDIPAGVLRGNNPTSPAEIDANAVVPPRIDPSYINLSNDALRHIVSRAANEMKATDKDRWDRMNATIAAKTPGVDLTAENIRLHLEMQSKFNTSDMRRIGQAVRNEMMNRLGRKLTFDARQKTSSLDDGALSGPHPLVELADYLMSLSDELQ